jgi:hypothetical protein
MPLPAALEVTLTAPKIVVAGWTAVTVVALVVTMPSRASPAVAPTAPVW